MCVYSMVAEQARGWMEPYTVPFIQPNIYPTPYTGPNQFPLGGVVTSPFAPGPKPPEFTQDMADFVSKLMKGAQEYDRKTGQPDCELEDKKKIIKDLADKLGVTIEIP